MIQPNYTSKNDKIRFYNCDCEEFMQQSTKKWDLAIVDPPYGINITKSARLKRYNKNKNKWDNNIPNEKYFNILFDKTNNQIIWGGNYFYLPPTRCFLIWDKQQPQNISFASCEYAWTSFELSAKTFYMRPQNADDIHIHPTQKPVALYKWLLSNYAKQGDTILDTHGGSMSIAIACHDLDFELDICEKDADYFELALKRFKQHEAQLKLF